MIDSPSITDAPLDDELVRKSAPTLLLALTWLYVLETADAAKKRTDEHLMEKALAVNAAAIAIAQATGFQPEAGIQ